MTTPHERITEGLTPPGLPVSPGPQQVQGALAPNAELRKPIFDPQGKIIGYNAPPPPPGPTPTELVTQGLKQRVIDAENAMVPVIEEMTGIAREVRTLMDKTSQWSFKDRLAAERKRAELLAKFEEGKKQLHKLRQVAGMYGQDTPFLKSADAHVAAVSRHFKDEGPGPLNRF